MMEEVVDDLLPKKPPLVEYKVTSHLKLYCMNGEPVFFEHRDGPVLPTLRFVHRYPTLFTTVTVDEGAIPFILGGANIMCPGLTNDQSSIPDGLEVGDAIVVMCHGKEHAIAVGNMSMSSADIVNKGKGIGITVDHALGDGLFNTERV